MWGAYKDYWQRAFQFRGVTTRAQYWLVVLIGAIIGMVVGVAYEFGHEAAMWVMYGYGVLCLVPSTTMLVRRLHDTNRSGWYSWIVAIPFVGWILLLVWICQASQPSRFRRTEQNPLDVGTQGGI